MHSCVPECCGTFKRDEFNSGPLIEDIRTRFPDVHLLGMSGCGDLRVLLRDSMGDVCVDCVLGIDAPSRIIGFFGGESAGISPDVAVQSA